MTSYADKDLIDLADGLTTSPVSHTHTASVSCRTAANRRDSAERDSFSDLTNLMKAKKPYAAIPPPSPGPSLAASTNSIPFASRVRSGSSFLSPLARPYHPDGSVAAYLQDQARSPPVIDPPSAMDYSQQDMEHLESMLKELEDVSVDDDCPTVQPRSSATESLPPGLELRDALSLHVGPIAPPTPVRSIGYPPPDEPMVRITMHVWDAMGKDLEVLNKEKRALETRVARLEKQKSTPIINDYEAELQTQIGKLQYQNESNKNQKATMARALSEKDAQIKHLQLDLASANERLETAAIAIKEYGDVVAERDYLQITLKNDRDGSSRLHTDLTNIDDRKVQTLSQKINDLKEALKKATTDEYKTLAQDRLDQLNQRGKLLRSTQEKYAVEHAKVGQLEDFIENLQHQLSQVGDLQAQLSERISTCDRLRTKLKTQEKVLEDSTQRLTRASNVVQALRGAVHPVKPRSDTKLSSIVMGCTECYAKNISCDNKARCRHCTESNEDCVRWRCSLKHILGQCPNIPCTFPHEADGWLLANEPRPQW